MEHSVIFDITRSSPANIWKFLRTLGIGKKRSGGLQGMISLDNLSRHFSSSVYLDPQTRYGTIDYQTILNKKPLMQVPSNLLRLRRVASKRLYFH